MSRKPKLKILESDVQSQIIELCGYMGIDVLKTSRVRKKCWHCRRYPQGGDGVTKGLPDLFIQPKNGNWGAFWLGIEVKGGDTKLSPEQKALVEKNKIVIVRDVKEFKEKVDGVIRTKLYEIT